MIYEAGHEGSGLANAGSAALASDPSVLMSNPAGISQLRGTQVNLNTQVILGDINFSRDEGNTFGGNEGSNALIYLPGSSLFISHEINDRASIGFGMYGNFGLALDYDDDWAGRYFTQESAILCVSFQPTYAYKINVLGLGNADDGQLLYKDTDWGVGVNLGLLYNLSERTTLGLAYTSKIDLEFEDSPELKDISNPLLNLALNRIGIDQLNVDVTVPQTVLGSLSHRLDERWTLLGSLGWQDWSEFGKMGIEVDSNLAGSTASIDRQYKDTWHLAVGAQNQINPKLRWNVGVAYDSSAVEDEDRTVDNPMNDSWRLATGLNYQLEEGLDLHMSYTLVWLGDMDVQQTKARSCGSVSGEYANAALHVLGGGVVWRF